MTERLRRSMGPGSLPVVRRVRCIGGGGGGVGIGEGVGELLGVCNTEAVGEIGEDGSGGGATAVGTVEVFFATADGSAAAVGNGGVLVVVV